MPIDQKVESPFIRLLIFFVITIIIYFSANSIAKRYKTTIIKEIKKLYNKITCSAKNICENITYFDKVKKICEKIKCNNSEN